MATVIFFFTPCLSLYTKEAMILYALKEATFVTFMAEGAKPKPISQYNTGDIGFQEEVKLHKVSSK